MADMSPRTDASRPTASQRPAEHFLNRELGILAFNRRVLAQARNPADWNSFFLSAPEMMYR